MDILLTSYFFYPEVGGIQTIARILAEQFVARGHRVTVATTSRGDDPPNCPYTVLRRPSPAKLFRAVRECDVVLQANVSLNLAWPLLFLRRPWVISHHNWTTRVSGERGWRDRLKRRLFHRARHIAVSRVLADDLGLPCEIVPNTYRTELFRLLPGVKRDQSLVFLGRLVSQKGLDVLLRALAELAQQNQRPTLTIIGGGPELPALQPLADALGVSAQVRFAGEKTGDELVALLNQHQIMVVPSVILEPFGVVVLEGLACGCVVAGSAAGGIPDAIGPCGATFPPGDAAELARVLGGLLQNPDRLAACRARAPEHLRQFAPAAIADRYLDVLKIAVAPSRPR